MRRDDNHVVLLGIDVFEQRCGTPTTTQNDDGLLGRILRQLIRWVSSLVNKVCIGDQSSEPDKVEGALETAEKAAALLSVSVVAVGMLWWWQLGLHVGLSSLQDSCCLAVSPRTCSKDAADLLLPLLLQLQLHLHLLCS